MPRIERILCPVDFSEFSATAYDYAQSLACHYKATLYLLHVIDSLAPYRCYFAFPEGYDEAFRGLSAPAEQQLREFAETHSQHLVEPQCQVSDGVATDLILSFAAEQAASLIVMGTHGTRGVDRVLLGSVTNKVLRKARVPVLAVRKPEHDAVAPGEGSDGIHLQRIIFCTDFSVCSEEALGHAVSLAEEYKAELTLLHVLEGVAPANLENEITKLKTQIEQLIPGGAHCATKPIVLIGKPYQQIIGLALESRADLIVMGVRGRNAVDLALLGSTTERVVQLGPCPVLVVHTSAGETDKKGD
jgi:nucleotide-binding universal stress UspA family protein